MKSVRIHFLQHVSFEGPGYFGLWAQQKGFSVSGTKLFEQVTFPDHESYDWLVIMGGPMSIHDEHEFSWLRAEKQFIRSAVDAGKIVLGVCLGAQLIAGVLGTRVYPNQQKEIGWFPIEQTSEGKDHLYFSQFPEALTVMHWHGETFDLPAGAVRLFSSAACLNQAFIFNKRVFAFQFHFEFTPESLALIIENCRNELVPDRFIQTETDIIANSRHCQTTNHYLSDLLDRLLVED